MKAPQPNLSRQDLEGALLITILMLLFILV